LGLQEPRSTVAKEAAPFAGHIRHHAPGANWPRRAPLTNPWSNSEQPSPDDEPRIRVVYSREDFSTKSEDDGVPMRRAKITPLPERVAEYPELRYMGSKHRLLPWIHGVSRALPFDTAADPFVGSGCVAYLLKAVCAKPLKRRWRTANTGLMDRP